MSGLSRIPGFPSPEREDSLKFYVLNSLPYSARMIIYLLLVAFGFLIQYITMNPWPGAFLLICATILGLFVVLTVMTGLKVLKPTKIGRLLTWTEFMKSES